MKDHVHAELGGSDSEWQGFGRELSRTGVAGDCKSERSYKQRQRIDAQKPDKRLTNGGRMGHGLRRALKPTVTDYSKSDTPQAHEAMRIALSNELG